MRIFLISFIGFLLLVPSLGRFAQADLPIPKQENLSQFMTGVKTVIVSCHTNLDDFLLYKDTYMSLDISGYCEELKNYILENLNDDIKSELKIQTLDAIKAFGSIDTNPYTATDESLLFLDFSFINRTEKIGNKKINIGAVSSSAFRPIPQNLPKDYRVSGYHHHYTGQNLPEIFVVEDRELYGQKLLEAMRLTADQIIYRLNKDQI